MTPDPAYATGSGRALAVSAETVQAHMVRSFRPLLTHYLFCQIADVEKFRVCLRRWLGPKKQQDNGEDKEKIEQDGKRRLHASADISKLQSGYPILDLLAAPGFLPSAGILTEKDARSLERGQLIKVRSGGEEPAGPPAVLLPMTLAFTWTGLDRLEIDKVTLATFPEPFRQGMAARAELLGDVGHSAPENWQGWLGSRNIHVLLGLFLPASPATLQRFLAEQQVLDPNPRQRGNGQGELFDLFLNSADLCEAFLEGEATLRGQIALTRLKQFAEATGLVTRHIDCGFRTYRWFNGRPYPVEHFGFRDGISQPFLTLSEPDELRPSPSGGGHPRAGGTWDVVMPGEIFLGCQDEDNLTAIQPINTALREHGTYMVFRKLAQDVIGFHNLLKKNRALKEDQDRLAAQMMGRWPNGAPLVRHPHSPHAYGPDSASLINDFRYHDEDPHGRKCPLEAHIRRTNPRDTQLRDLARRHRILRQSIPYGGRLVEDPDKWDGRERGLLFICYNAQIDSQFELIQSHWINRGDMFGQAGLGRCPIVGSDTGKAESAFHVPDNPAPVNLPELVTNRGGDYFFVPSIKALDMLADGDRFQHERTPGFPQKMEDCPAGFTEADADRLRQELINLIAALMSGQIGLPTPIPKPHLEANQGPTDAPGDTVEFPSLKDLIDLLKKAEIDPRILVDQPDLEANPGLAETPQLLSEDRIKLLALMTVLGWPFPVIRIRLPYIEYTGRVPQTQHVAFVGQYADVVKVLSEETNFGVGHHKKTLDDLTRGSNFLMGMDDIDDRAERGARLRLLHDAIGQLSGQPPGPNSHPSQWFKAELYGFLRPLVRRTMTRVLPAGKMDLVRDLGLIVPVAVAERLLGVPGPHRISPTAIAAMFARLEFTDVPADWLKRLPQSMEHEKPIITIMAWAQAIFREVFVNIIRARELTDHGRRMTNELMAHIEDLMEREYRRPASTDGQYRKSNLLTALMEMRRDIVSAPAAPNPDDVRLLVDRSRLLLAELVVGGIYTVGKAFASVVDFMFDPKFVGSIHYGGAVYTKKTDDLSERLFWVLGRIAEMPDGPVKERTLDAFIGEALRFAFRSLLFRVCKNRTEVNGQWIEKGDLVAAIIPGANLDLRQFGDPFEFRLDRPLSEYLHFGAHPRSGPSAHYCLGAELAKAELREMLLAIAPLRNVRRAAGPRGALEELLRLPQSLVIRFDPVSEGK
jgi:Dyp-type peroxidase family